MKYPSVYRMVSDGQDCALGINGKYQIIAIRVEDQTAAIYRDTEMTLPVLFYEISDGAFGAHFYNAICGPRSLSTSPSSELTLHIYEHISLKSKKARDW